jgi:hypothetical protein
MPRVAYGRAPSSVDYQLRYVQSSLRLGVPLLQGRCVENPLDDDIRNYIDKPSQSVLSTQIP